MNQFYFTHRTESRRLELVFAAGSDTYQISVMGERKMGELRALLLDFIHNGIPNDL
ncbi:hypothetical protein UFOVP75_194 [uncultured Caudovirales phage]|uniref:Uncharacterized protein n=1 Tax=uncultured Caudovirales phage TaxID=2100421 RepID=A0A6J5L2K0_9CAUD|nr:hypothetical protein UFOVP75_194 [uncultured Caudovirales phage]